MLLHRVTVSISNIYSNAHLASQACTCISEVSSTKKMGNKLSLGGQFQPLRNKIHSFKFWVCIYKNKKLS